MTLYKVLDSNGQPNNGGTGSWPLPTDQPGDWIGVTGKLVPCRNGLHLCDGELQLLSWLGPRIFVAEHDGERIDDDGTKIVVRRARLLHETAWDERIARLFAADCAERVLPIFERARPNDDRPRKAIRAARAFTNGEIDRQALFAAWDAAWAAAWDAAQAAAWDAARAAAWDAAQAAAQAAARAAAGDAECQWQAERLAQYLSGALVGVNG
jgi:hypothetical protein